MRETNVICKNNLPATRNQHFLEVLIMILLTVPTQVLFNLETEPFSVWNSRDHVINICLIKALLYTMKKQTVQIGPDIDEVQG